ncbi:alpha/beta hydrolase [Micromonospora sp. NPDC049523]|uniref:alpha/beta hydrolase n=1 Tax=Micromonospora sp. NPDC049523 TaxID=3155921 RepID=UPI003446DCF6
MTESTNQRNAVLIPGGGYGLQAPLLMYAADAVEARGARQHPISWNGEPRQVPPDERFDWVGAHVSPVLDTLPAEAAGGPPLLIGKSLGTYAAPLAADRGLPAIWLTPLLTVEPVAAQLRRATAPALLIGGTADPAWDGALARQLSPYVLEVPDADHAMFVPGPLAGSAAVLGRVATAIEEWLDNVVWRTPVAARN